MKIVPSHILKAWSLSFITNLTAGIGSYFCSIFQKVKDKLSTLILTGKAILSFFLFGFEQFDCSPQSDLIADFMIETIFIWTFGYCCNSYGFVRIGQFDSGIPAFGFNDLCDTIHLLKEPLAPCMDDSYLVSLLSEWFDCFHIYLQRSSWLGNKGYMNADACRSFLAPYSMFSRYLL